MRYIVALGMTAIGLMLCQPVIASAQARPEEVPKEAHDEAQRSLPALRQIVTPETYKRLGFQSVEEASRSSLEAPMRVLMVRLDRLREYRPETKTSEMLEDTHEVRYPVSVDGQVRTSVVMRQIEGKWQVARIGRPALTQSLTDIVRKRVAMGRAPAEALFEVEIPALSLYFVGREADSRLMLTSTVDDARFDLKQGEELDAQQLFARIAPYARDLKTGPHLSD
jgi:hypothetical protein